MDQKIVRQLESELEAAIARVMMHSGLKHLPLIPSDKTIHLMSKAAITVYETAVETRQHDR